MSYFKSPLLIIFSRMDVWKNKEKSLKSPWKCTSKVLEKSLKKVCHDLWEPWYKTLWTQYRLQFESNLFQSSHVSCWSERRDPIVTGSKVKVNFCTVYKALWAQYRLQFKFNHFQTSHVSCGWWGEEPYWILSHRVRGQGQFCQLPRGCHAFRCLVTMCT